MKTNGSVKAQKKKEKNKKHEKLKHNSVPISTIQMPDNVLKSQFVTSAKIQDLIKNTLKDVTREKIVQLLLQVKEKAEYCYDFELSFWLDKYFQLDADVNLIEVAYLIVNAGHIYDRKVDILYELVRRSVEQSLESSESAEKKQQQTKSRRKITRQAVSVHDRLYESEMLPKTFKSLSLEKSTESVSSGSLKAPPHYFKNWSEYKTWRINHKKKMKSAIPYSTVCDDLYLHPSMWSLSCIEDFDYDDDLDTKRNYRMFTHYMEHRYNTLIPDINFILHFKVKDFIDAEEDEIEAMSILGLPTPPMRQWPPFCNSSYSKELAKQTYNIDIGESAEDYIKKYVAFEDIVLEKKVYEIDNNLLRNAAEMRKIDKSNQREIFNNESNAVNKRNDNCIDSTKEIASCSQLSSDVSLQEVATQISEMNHRNLATESDIHISNDDASRDARLQADQSLGTDSGIAEINNDDSSRDARPQADQSLRTDSGTAEISNDDSLRNAMSQADQNLATESCSSELGKHVSLLEVSSQAHRNLSSESENILNSIETDNVEESSIGANADHGINVNPSEVLQAAVNKTHLLEISPNVPVITTEINSISSIIIEHEDYNANGNLSSNRNDNEIVEEIKEIEVELEIETRLEESETRNDILDELNLEAIERSANENILENPTIANADIGKKNAFTIIAESIQNNISENIVIRLSVDEGIAFSELDDVDRAMISPVVELVDIFRPIKEEILEEEDFNFAVGKISRNILRIDEAYMHVEENFHLPVEILYKEPQIVQNILKLPLSKLKRKVQFSLPQEFDLFMKHRLKRKNTDKPEHAIRTIKVFKLNEENMKNIPITPSSTPLHEDDFLGFDETDILSTSITWEDVLSSTRNDQNDVSKLTTPNRTISRDSGIGLTSTLDSQNLNTNSTFGDAELSLVRCSTSSSPAPNESDIARQNESIFSELITIPEETDDVFDSEDYAVLGNNENYQLRDKEILGESEGTLKDTSPSTEDTELVLPSIPEPTEFEQSLYNKCKSSVERRTNEMNEMTERIQNWHRHLRPILANSMDRHHFDIFAIGSDIINVFPSGKESTNATQIITLEDVMHDHDPSFLSRYFLSMLQLANTNNVQIEISNQNSEEPTPLGDIYLKLLNRKRQSVSMEDDVGANIHPSRKRQHFRSDESDAESEHRHQSSPSKQTRKGLPDPIQPDAIIAPVGAISPISKFKPTTKNSSGASQSSNQRRKCLFRKKQFADDKPVATNLCAVATTSHHISIDNRKRKDVILDSCESMLPSQFPVRQEIGYSVNSSIISGVSKSFMGNNSLSENGQLKNIQISKNNDSSNIKNITILSKNQETTSNQHTWTPLVVEELPPFELIRRHDKEAENILRRYSAIHSNESVIDHCTDKTSEENTVSRQNRLPEQISRPQIVRAESMRSSMKRLSHFSIDDLDSGIFSEFSPSENNSTKL